MTLVEKKERFSADKEHKLNYFKIELILKQS